MRLNCPACQAAIPPAEINLPTSTAKCACGEVFRFTPPPAPRPPAGFASQAAPPIAPTPSGGPVPPAMPVHPGMTHDAWGKMPVQMPAGFDVRQRGDGVVVTRRWFSLKYVVLVLFCLFWDGFLFHWYSRGIGSGAPLIFLLFPLIHVAVGVALTYTTIAGFVNKTDIALTGGRLSVRHYPLWWPGAKTIAATSIAQLYCEEREHRTRRGNTTLTYSVHAILHGGSRIPIITDMEQPNHAAFIEQELERALGIQDRPVAGEMRPA